MKIFPLSDPILLSLAPTIANTIADYLQSIASETDIKSLKKNCADDVVELQPDLSWQQQFQRSIRQIPTLQYQYVSTIAHQLAAKSALTSLEICQQLQTSISTLTVGNSSPDTFQDRSLYLELCSWYNEASYIYFQLTPESIEIWLNYIHDLPLVGVGFTAASPLQHPLCENLAGSSGGSINLAVYAHARCCSLLKLADADKLATITDTWQISTPNWLGNVVRPENRLRAESNYIFEHPAEQRLIHALMEVLDRIYGDNGPLETSRSESKQQITDRASQPHQKSSHWTKLTINLAQNWLDFNRHCQIFGDLKCQNPRLAIARCGLTAISRRYLQVLLEGYLGVEAVVEL